MNACIYGALHRKDWKDGGEGFGFRAISGAENISPFPSDLTPRAISYWRGRETSKICMILAIYTRSESAVWTYATIYSVGQIEFADPDRGEFRSTSRGFAFTLIIIYTVTRYTGNTRFSWDRWTEWSGGTPRFVRAGENMVLYYYCLWRCVVYSSKTEGLERTNIDLPGSPGRSRETSADQLAGSQNSRVCGATEWRGRCFQNS